MVFGFYIEDYVGVPFIQGFKGAVNETYRIDYKTIGQFTGLRDNNREDIFDGDIVTYDGTPYLVNALKATGVIVNYKGSWALKYKATYKTSDGRDYYDYYLFSCEDFFDRKSIVIGNIYENPELLSTI
jgi:uncharacterized phage protein (TIGR01671 family)